MGDVEDHACTYVRAYKVFIKTHILSVALEGSWKVSALNAVKGLRPETRFEINKDTWFEGFGGQGLGLNGLNPQCLEP